MLTRRVFLAGAAAASMRAEAASRYRVGITTNTRGGWEKDVFLSFREAHQAGYSYVESFIDYFSDYLDKPGELLKKAGEIGLKFDTISNGGRMEMHFEDPARHEKIIEQHMRLVGFIKRLGCDHLKINTGPRRPGGTTDQDLKNMAVVFNLLGKRISGEGLKFGVHAHMWTQFQTRSEIDAIMERTNPRYVYLVLDTGHVTMAGIDPVELARAYAHRIVEFHLKDTRPEDRGGHKGPPPEREGYTAKGHRIFFELGHGGVDFPAILAILKKNNWDGWVTVELDSTDTTPKDSAATSKKYLENVLHLKV
jgi:sugar phosphate isomerase/epimerase